MDFENLKNKTQLDYLVIGSGFGGSVSALRLAEKGYSVGVLEEGGRYRDDDFPQTNWNLRKWLWAPSARCFGIQRLNFLRDVWVLSGAGVGGGVALSATGAAVGVGAGAGVRGAHPTRRSPTIVIAMTTRAIFSFILPS